MKKSELKIGTLCLYEDTKVTVMTEIQKDGSVGVGWFDMNGKQVALTVNYKDLEDASAEPLWFKRAKEASDDFKYGITAELQKVWDSDLTESQKCAQVERMMITARHASETRTSHRASSLGRRL